MRILITGADGFVGTHLYNALSKIPTFIVFKGTRELIDLYSQKSINKFININKIDSIIHCAITGGYRIEQDSPSVIYKNVLMFENLMAESSNITRFINIASGAEYDRRNNITGNDYKNVPVDYYGLSKYTISSRIAQSKIPTYVNFRLFSCFGVGEQKNRMIIANILNYINNMPITIEQDRYIDFFYIKDFVNIVLHFMSTPIINITNQWKDVNMTYGTSLKLSDIGDIINNLDTKKSNIIINLAGMDNSYCGKSGILNFNIPLIGLESGIRECYDKLK